MGKGLIIIVLGMSVIIGFYHIKAEFKLKRKSINNCRYVRADTGKIDCQLGC